MSAQTVAALKRLETDYPAHRQKASLVTRLPLTGLPPPPKDPTAEVVGLYCTKTRTNAAPRSCKGDSITSIDAYKRALCSW